MTPPAALAFALALAAGRADGVVTYVTASAGYVDAGGGHGATTGQTLKVFRRGKQVGTCEVVAVADDTLLCRSDRISPGERVALPPAPAREAPSSTSAPPKKLPPLPPRRRLDRLRGLVASAPFHKVENRKSEALLPVATRASATLREQFWSISTAPGAFARTSIDGAVRESLPTAFGTLFASGEARVVGDLLAPPTKRNRPGDPVDVYVWNASAGITDGPLLGEVGRFRPRLAPGALLLDGAQVGGRIGPAEVGVYGGAVPDLLTVVPSLGQLTAGVYAGLDLDAAPGILVLPRARVALVSTPNFAHARTELQAQTEVVWTGMGTVGAGALVDSGAKIIGVPALDGADLELDVTALAPVHIAADYRFLGPRAVDFDALDGYAPIGGAHQGSATASCPFLDDALEVGAEAGAGYDLATRAARGYLGPTLALPRAFGSLGGLDLGVLTEQGALSGTSGWFGVRLAPFAALQVVSRLSYFDAEALGEPYREVGIMTLLDAPLLPWLAVRGSLYGQQALPPLRGAVRATPTLVTADLAVTGTM